MWGKTIRKSVALLCAVVLSFCACSAPMHVKAATTVSPESVIDIALSKVGVHASSSVLSDFVEYIKTAWTDAVDTYNSTFTESAADDIAAFAEWCETNVEKPIIRRIIAARASGLWSDDTLTADLADYWIVNSLLGDDVNNITIYEDKYTITDDLVEVVHDDFEDYINEVGLGYYYAPVYSIDDLNVDFFYTLDDYNNFKSYVLSSNKNTLLYWVNGSGGREGYLYDNTIDILYLRENLEEANMYAYDYSWEQMYNLYYIRILPTQSFSVVDKETFDAQATYKNFYEKGILGYSSDIGKYYIFYGEKKGRQIIFEDLDSLKEYAVGIRPVYYTTNNIYDNSVDNSVDVSGETLEDFTFSYDTIYNDIVNSNDYSETNTNEIVNSNNTTIINNYYSGSGDGDGTGSGDSSGDSEDEGLFDEVLDKLDGTLGNIIGAVDDLLVLVMGFISDGLNLIVGMITSIIDLINSFRNQTTGLSSALAAFFPYIPEDIWNIITGTIVIICGLAIIEYLKSK